jgi:hypothetical protein
LISRDEVMPTSEARLRRELHTYAIESGKLAYPLPNGVGEDNPLQLSERVSAAAEDVNSARERARRGDRDDAISLMPAAVGPNNQKAAHESQLNSRR